VIAPGDRAPEFTVESVGGGAISLAKFRGRPLVLYFYPKSGSLGCTHEAREFAHNYSEFRDRQIEVIGVSVDSRTDQARFVEECKLPFPIVPDEEKRLSHSYGVLGAFGYAKRVTFLIGPDGRVVDVIHGMLPGPHVTRALAFARALPTTPGGVTRAP
jgi:thioredoxin-dependent peroxiredoxin